MNFTTTTIPATSAGLGRVTTSDGREHFALQSSPTMGAANAGPADPPVLISRVSANASDGIQWIEIANAGSGPVALYDATQLGTHWQVGGVAYQIPAGVELAASGRVLLTSAEPADVCLSGRIPPGVRVVGPLLRPLSSTEMSLTLAQPTPWGAGMASGELDQLHYRNQAPWPYQAADVVLSRKELRGFGSEPANWHAVPSGGLTPFAGLVDAPVDLASATALCSFDAFVNEAGQLEVRWVAIPQTGTVAFRLLRSPLVSPESRTIVAQQPVTNAGAGAASLTQWIDADADPHQQYVYWLQTVGDGDTAHDVAFTTLRVEVHQVYAPFIAR